VVFCFSSPWPMWAVGITVIEIRHYPRHSSTSWVLQHDKDQERYCASAFGAHSIGLISRVSKCLKYTHDVSPLCWGTEPSQAKPNVYSPMNLRNWRTQPMSSGEGQTVAYPSGESWYAPSHACEKHLFADLSSRCLLYSTLLQQSDNGLVAGTGSGIRQ